MPIEIRELVIKTVVGPEGQGNGSSVTGTNANLPSEELIKTCVEKVMEILREKNER